MKDDLFDSLWLFLAVLVLWVWIGVIVWWRMIR
jgi:hypothetical protein